MASRDPQLGITDRPRRAWSRPHPPHQKGPGALSGLNVCHRHALQEANTLKILLASEQPHPMLGFTLIASRCRAWRMTDLRSASTASPRGLHGWRQVHSMELQWA
jgi:hypothetical protein